MSHVYKRKTQAEIVIEGTDLGKMEAEARSQFARAFGEVRWELTIINARLDMILVGGRNEWLPGMWHASYEATEL